MSMVQDPNPSDVTARLRVLVECDDPTVQDGVERVLRESGYDVTGCAGPATRRGGECPLVVHGDCGLVDGADVIVHALDPADARNRAVLSAIVETRPGMPVVVEASAAGHVGDSPDRAVHEVPFPMTRSTLIGAVEQSAPEPR